MSQTLDKWIYGEKYVKERKVKKYFFIKWDNSYLPDECVWLEKKPENINFSKEITWNIFGIKEKINVVGFLDFSSKKQKKKPLKSDIINESPKSGRNRKSIL